MSSQLSKLARDIEISRMEMLQLASKTELSDKTVVEASVKLDSLLNNYHFLINKKP